MIKEDNPTSDMKKLFFILIVFTISACGELKSPQEHLKDHVRATVDSVRKDLSAYGVNSLGKVDSVLTSMDTDSTILKTRNELLKTQNKASDLLNGVSGLVDEVTNSKEKQN